MKVENKIKTIMVLMVSLFVLTILFIAIQISQERSLYHLEKRISNLENLILNMNDMEENINYPIEEDNHYREPYIHDIQSLVSENNNEILTKVDWMIEMRDLLKDIKKDVNYIRRFKK